MRRPQLRSREGWQRAVCLFKHNPKSYYYVKKKKTLQNSSQQDNDCFVRKTELITNAQDKSTQLWRLRISVRILINLFLKNIKEGLDDIVPVWLTFPVRKKKWTWWSERWLALSSGLPSTFIHLRFCAQQRQRLAFMLPPPCANLIINNAVYEMHSSRPHSLHFPSGRRGWPCVNCVCFLE